MKKWNRKEARLTIAKHIVNDYSDVCPQEVIKRFLIRMFDRSDIDVNSVVYDEETDSYITEKIK